MKSSFIEKGYLHGRGNGVLTSQVWHGLPPLHPRERCCGRRACCWVCPQRFINKQEIHSAFIHLFTLQIIIEHLLCAKNFLSNGSQSVVPRPAASVSCGNLLEMQTLRYHPRPTVAATLEVWKSVMMEFRESPDIS